MRDGVFLVGRLFEYWCPAFEAVYKFIVDVLLYRAVIRQIKKMLHRRQGFIDDLVFDAGVVDVEEAGLEARGLDCLYQ